MSSLPYRPLNPELESVLDKLRMKIQIYLFFHGTALVLAALCVGFFVTLSIDWISFQLTRLELPLAFRILLAIGMVGTITWVLANQVFLRLLKSKKSRSLALILERRFPALNDRLITAVELQGPKPEHHSRLTEAMLDHTIQEVSQSAEKLELSDVFDWKPLIQGWAVALVLLFGVGTVAGAMPESFERWMRAFVYFDEIYWVRQTNLEVVVLAEPGDRERLFVDGVYKHPRGADLKLLVTVPEGQNPLGLDWIIPEEVEIDYSFRTTRGGDVKPLARRGERQFQFKMNSVLDDFDFWISGNDYINRKPYRVQIVSSPEADSIVLHCDYPAYTNLNSVTPTGIELDEQKLQGKQIRVRSETAFVLAVNTNKPLRNVIVQAGPYEFSVGQFDSEGEDTVSLRMLDENGSYGARESVSGSWAQHALDQSRETIRLPFLLTSKSKDEVADRVLHLPAELGAPWVLPPDSEVKIYLEDQDGIISAEPKRFAILGIPDEPPVIETELTGIGTAITANAMIPVKGVVTDDYGIVKARFDFKVDEAKVFRLRPFKNSPNEDQSTASTYVLEHKLKESENSDYERFNVNPLDLAPGQKLILTVYAIDNDDLNGPHEIRGRNYTFTIVTEDELLAILHDREVNLRRQFIQIISEVERTRDDLVKHREVANELAQLREADSPEAETLEELQIRISNAAERSRHQIGKNRTETVAVYESFARILAELVNNRIHSKEQNERIESLILTPLKVITSSTFEEADIAAGLFSQANQAGDDPLPPLNNTIEALETLLTQMKVVLAEISDLAEFHEALQELRNLIKSETELRDKTEKKQQEDLKKLKDSLKNLGI